MTALDWLGCATFRLRIGELVVFLDAYVDRVPSAKPVGTTIVGYLASVPIFDGF